MWVRKFESTIVREIEGGGLIINSETGYSNTVNETGLLYMKAIDEHVKDMYEIALNLHNTFDGVEVETICDDLHDFFSDMAESGFVAVAGRKEDVEENALLSLHIDITSECNERCIHCYIPNGAKNQCKRLSLQVFRLLVDDFVELGGKYIVLSGGEPLMHPDIMEMLRYCSEKNLETSIFSNLTLLSDGHLQMMKTSHVSLVQVSVYSMNPDVHDAITQKRGALVKTLSAIERLRNEGLNVQVACPVMLQNKGGVADIIKYVKQKGLSLRTNSLILPTTDGDDTFIKTSALTLEQKKSMLCDMIEVDSAFTKEVLLEKNENSVELCSNPKVFLNSSLCEAGVNSCSVSVDGYVCPCPKWQSYHLGNIYEKRLTEIWYNNPLLSTIRRINRQKNFPECLNCKAIDYCKRCLKLNEQTSEFGLHRFSEDNCKYARMAKELFEIEEKNA